MELQRWSFVNSVHFHDFLEEFDRLNLNEITTGQFRSGMTRATYKLTNDEFDTLVKHYHSDTREGYFKWRKFADDVIQFVAPQNLEKDPQTTPPRPQETLQLRTRTVATSAPAEDVERLIAIIARFITTRRLSLTEQFQLKDRMNHRRVTQTGFAQVLQLVGLYITKAEIDRLCRFYHDPENNFVDYPRFVADVEAKAGRIFGDRACTSLVVNEIPSYGFENSQWLVQKSQSPRDLEWVDILDRLSAYVYRRRIRLYEFLEGFDPLRKGHIPKQKFRTVCGQANLPLTPEQLEVVLEHFGLPEKQDMFNYRAFCQEVNKVFGPTELNRTPLTPGLIRAVTRTDPSETLQKLPPTDEPELREILDRLRRIVITRRMNIREQFWDYDRRPHKSYISMQQFKQSIARLGLTTRPHDFDVLCKRYCCTDLGDMNYRAFCNDIDPEP
jgi:Ca2+-binding EF-hand superfamily protein